MFRVAKAQMFTIPDHLGLRGVHRAAAAVLTADGRDPIADLTAAAARRETGTARDVAAVLDYRLDPSGK